MWEGAPFPAFLLIKRRLQRKAISPQRIRDLLGGILFGGKNFL